LARELEARSAGKSDQQVESLVAELVEQCRLKTEAGRRSEVPANENGSSPDMAYRAAHERAVLDRVAGAIDFLAGLPTPQEVVSILPLSPKIHDFRLRAAAKWLNDLLELHCGRDRSEGET
jgi:hypothetical protein